MKLLTMNKINQKTKKALLRLFCLLATSLIFNGCKKFLDVIPDNIATIDYAFQLRSTAERYLFSCYSYLPSSGDFQGAVSNAAGDEFWLVSTSTANPWKIARGTQNKSNSYMNFWQGANGGKDLYQGIRECNIFLDNIQKVPDMQQDERDRWAAEAKFLKAYFHYFIFRMYGPIPLIRENVPVDAAEDEVYPLREPVDSCVNYIVGLLDEAIPALPEQIDNEISELGRITKSIALCVKAEVLMTAASPLFNGNPDYTGYTDPEGHLLFNTTFSSEKWERALQACKEAVEFCEAKGNKLYVFDPAFFQYDISDRTKIEMNIRNAVSEKWNSEIIWGNTNSMASSIQSSATPRGLDPAKVSNAGTAGSIAPPLKIAEMFYSKNGVPITEDKDFDYSARFGIRSATAEYRYDLKEGYTTANLNFDREARYYADLGFDGSIWYGQGRFDDAADLFFVSSKKGQPAAAQNLASYSVTGYWPKKLVNFNNVIGDGNTYTIQAYPWPNIRLASVYLYYAEALNEVEGPNDEIYEYLDRIRARAGLEGVVASWTQHSRNPQKFQTKDGLREIIQRERQIEMAFEGQRYWDLRRWKTAVEEMNKPITGWDLDQEEASAYYREKVIFNQTFSTRDYLWPIPEQEMLANKRISQNPGW